MALTVGSRLGSHEILGLLGAGGMGEVYLAHDTKLKRRVAIKLLPADAAHDTDRLARFHREAQAVAALNHPNIATIYDLQEAAGITYLVLELVEGETLADRLRGRPLPIGEALAIARQMLEALEAAHAKRICHRDLKPANVKLTADGVVKVLDFGIAKFLQRDERDQQATVDETSPGIVLGTAGYMSPEQAKGVEADERSDIFSFGCIFYELLSGHRAFDGNTTSEILANVLKSEVDFSRLPPDISQRLREILVRCLEKPPRQRWHAAADVRMQIESVSIGAPADDPESRSASWTRAVAVVAAAVVATITGGYAAWTLKPEPSRALTRFVLPLPDGQQFSHVGRPVLALSPDGSHLAYVANRRIYLRPMAGIESHVVAGSEEPDGVQAPVFSPDGQWIVFRSVGDGALKRVPLGGGKAVTICNAEALYGMEWSEAGLLFGQFGKGILQVSPDGGVPEVVVAAADGEVADSPQLLPGGKAILYSLRKTTEDWDRGRIVVHPLDGSAPSVVMDGGSAARFLPSGHLVYAVSGSLFARPFDLDSRTLTGRAVPVIEGIDRGSMQGGPGPIRAATTHYVVSSTGTLVFVPGTRESAAAHDLAWFDPKAPPVPLRLPPATYAVPRASIDGRFVAVERAEGGSADVWVVDLSGASAIRRLTFGGNSHDPIWSGDSQWIIFRVERDGDAGIFRQRADGAGTPERLTKPDAGAAPVPQSMSRDGAHLLFTQMKGGRSALWTLSIKDRRASPVAGVESADLIEAAFSPDGRWVVYQMSGPPRGQRPPIPESFVMPFPATGTPYQIPVTTNTVGNPVWTARGDAIIASVAINRDMMIPVSTSPALTFGLPEYFPQGGRLTGNPIRARRNWDPHRDGRIIGVQAATGQPQTASDAPRMHVVLNWFDELRERVR